MVEKDYHAYTAAEFLEDLFFINWVKYEMPEDEVFWSRWISSSPPNLNEFFKAQAELKAIFSTERIAIDEDVSINVWRKIESQLFETPAERISRAQMVMQFIVRYRLAAAVVLMAIFGAAYWLLQRGNTTKANLPISTKSRPAKDILHGSTSATITLADGSTVLLDGVGNGMVANDGIAAIVKQPDGTIAYLANEGKTGIELTYNTLNVPRGANIITLKLTDGTQVWLNAESSLRYPTAFAADERMVEITGEAYFEVAHNTQAPFKVKISRAGQDCGEVEVLGTWFNINAYVNEPSINTTLLKGSVKIENGGSSRMLTPGEQSKVNGVGVISINKNANIDQVIAWKSGFFSFENDDLKMVMQRLARWYDIEVVYPQGIPNIKFSGEIDGGLSLNQMLVALEKLRIHYKIEGKKLIVTH